MMIPTALRPPPNRIFMFSTELANRAAEAVAQGRVPSIVAYHMAQPKNQPYLRLQPRSNSDFMMNPSGSVDYRFRNLPKHMDTMFGGGCLPGMSAMGMPPRFNAVPQFGQYLKQQQQIESRNTLAVDELQQMMFGTSNGTPKGVFPPAGMHHMMDDQGGARPRIAGGYPGSLPSTFGQQQMFMNSHNYRLQPNFPVDQIQPQGSASVITSQAISGSGMLPSMDSPGHQRELAQDESLKYEPKSESDENPSIATDRKQIISPNQPPILQQQHQLSPTPQPPTQANAPHLPVLSPSSSLSSSSPLGSTIRSPPPYSANRPTDLNTLPGASSIGAPSPTNTNSPQTPHGPLTPRLSNTIGSPKDGEHSPFSPGSLPTTSGYSNQQVMHQNIRDASMKMTRHSPISEKPDDILTNKNIPPGFVPSDMRLPTYAGQRPNSLHLMKNMSPLAALPPNKSTFLGRSGVVGRSLMGMPPDQVNYPSKFSVESLTAPAKEELFYHQRFPMQPGNAYAAAAAYSQQPGLYYTGNKFLPGMLGQGQYQFPSHLQPSPQQFFPSNMPPQMYPPHGPFSIHHTGNRDAGM